MVISAEALESSLSELAESATERGGVHGPGSMAWRLGRESLGFLGAGRAALLQLAHPAVAFAIDQHSQTRGDLRGRFQRTFLHVFSMVFGDWKTASRAARAVHRIHQRVEGEIPVAAGRFRAGDRYRANEAESLTWVWATLVDTVLLVHSRFGDITLEDKRQYLRESARFAALFGLGEADVPGTYEDFKYYFNKKLASGEIEVTAPAREMAGYLFAAPAPALEPVMRWYRGLSAELLPRALARDFELDPGPLARAAVRLTLPVMGPVYWRLPLPVRQLPHYAEARRRMGQATEEGSDFSLWSLLDRLISARGESP